MPSLQPVRGTHDLLPEKSRLFRHIDHIAHKIASVYGFGEISTPIFEFTQVFEKNLGEESDIVNKEMYTFEDRGGDSITLRPEGTAPVARAFISEGLAQQIPLKLFYNGPMFRYERPQKGRQRQFHQFGAETLGVATPQADIESLCLAAQTLKELGVADCCQLEINSIGDVQSRVQYREKLVEYLSPYAADLSEDSQRRLTTNPLRILDSKNEKDREILTQAPTFSQSLNETSKNFFEQVLKGLEQHNVPFTTNDKLVRGFDYYSHTVFEFTTDQLGTQNAVLSGGRYDGLIKMMGGKDTPAVGWAAGVERLALLMEQKQVQIPTTKLVAIIPVDDSAQAMASELCQELRSKHIACDLGYSGNAGKRMKRANKIGASHALILGEEEIKNNQVTVKDLSSGEQKSLSRSDLIATLT